MRNIDKENLYKKEIAQMQKSLQNSFIRIKTLNEKVDTLKKELQKKLDK